NIQAQQLDGYLFLDKRNPTEVYQFQGSGRIPRRVKGLPPAFMVSSDNLVLGAGKPSLVHQVYDNGTVHLVTGLPNDTNNTPMGIAKIDGRMVIMIDGSAYVVLHDSRGEPRAVR